MLLSLCMIVRNEEAHLGRCLRLVEGLADEIIVMDTGSTDRTAEIAEECGARVFACRWDSDFARARNQSLEQARGRWILVLDADEQLLARDRDAVQGLLARHTPASGPPRVAFNLLQKNSSDGGHTGMRVPIVRLFPNLAQVRYEWPVHEQVATSLMRAGIPILESGVEILHDGYSDPARNTRKQERNRAILEAQVHAAGKVHPLTHFLLAGAKLDLGDGEGALESYRDCVRLAGEDESMAAGARVRIATCLGKLGRLPEARAVMPEALPYRLWHPELLKLRADSDAALGRFPQALEAYAALLALEDGTFFPPCNLPSVKISAVLGLGTLFKRQGQDALASQLLHSAKRHVSEGRHLDANWLARVLAD